MYAIVNFSNGQLVKDFDGDILLFEERNDADQHDDPKNDGVWFVIEVPNHVLVPNHCALAL